MGRYLIAVAYALCIVVIGQLLKGCDDPLKGGKLPDSELTIDCLKKGTPVYKLGKYSHCAVDSGKGWGES